VSRPGAPALDIRVVATDLDGTLLRSDSTLSARTRDALRSVRAAGIRVVAATARPPRIIDALFGTDLIDAALCGNGAIRYEPATRQMTITDAMPVELVRRVITRIVEAVPGAGFAAEDGHRVRFEPGYRYRPSLDNDRVAVGSTAELLTGPLVKLLVWLPDRNPAAAWAPLSASLGDLVDCSWSSEDAPWEIAARGVSKAVALAALCARWQVGSGQVIAFGDAMNDLSMLAWAGLGYAVANASAEVLAAAPHHAAGNDADGVAEVLENLVAGVLPRRW
jgi:Cof subfamily protein (haloacid dehalogenase superfamily)